MKNKQKQLPRNKRQCNPRLIHFVLLRSISAIRHKGRSVYVGALLIDHSCISVNLNTWDRQTDNGRIDARSLLYPFRFGRGQQSWNITLCRMNRTDAVYCYRRRSSARPRLLHSLGYAQFTPSARQDKTVLSVSHQAMWIGSRDRLAKSGQLADRSPSSRGV